MISKVKHRIFTEFELYLQSQKKIEFNATGKYLKRFKKIVTAYSKNLLALNPFMDYKLKSKI